MSHELKEQPTCGDTLLPLARTNLPVIAAGALLGMWLTGMPRLFLLYGAAAVASLFLLASRRAGGESVVAGTARHHAAFGGAGPA